jgi:hypothetical protein
VPGCMLDGVPVLGAVVNHGNALVWHVHDR